MTFLLPLAWWLGLLAFPIIAFYLLKTRQRRRSVSTLLFWDTLKPKMENSPLWRKLRRWLSLLLQLLIFLLLLAALARPAFDWEKSAPRRVLTILDPSASMAATSPAPSRWENAENSLRTAISRMRVQDEMALLSAENPPRILSGWTSDQRQLHRALDSATLLPTGTDPTSAFALAADLTTLRENAVKEVYSDSVWPPATPRDPTIRLIGDDSVSAMNSGLTLFAVRRSPVAPGDWQLDIEVATTQPFTGTLELLRDGEPIDRTPVVATPGNPWRKSWRGTSETGAKFAAHLVSDDILLTDNSAACELAPLTPLNVLVVPAPDPYLEAVLDAIPLVNWWTEKTFPQKPIASTSLIIAIGDAIPESAGPIPILLINPTHNGFWGTPEGEIEKAPITQISKTSPLVRQAGLGHVVVSRTHRWAPPPGTEILAASPEGPLLFGHWDRDPRWLVIGFDPVDSDLPLRTAFPVLISNLLQSLRSDQDAQRAAAVLPGEVETRMIPLVTATDNPPTPRPSGITLPGWWLFVLAGLLVLLAEWYSYNRRLTD